MIVGAAVGLIVVLATRNDAAQTVTSSEKWSAWAPTTTGTRAVRDIARHVSPSYRQANGRQLVGAVAGPMIVRFTEGTKPVSALLISSGISGRVAEHIDVTFPNAGVSYTLCGRLAQCQPSANPTVAEQVLLQREALELALYTFHYLPESDHVVVFLPPRPGVQQTDPRYDRAIYVPREALSDQLRSPLAATMQTPKSGIAPETLSQADGNTVLGILAGHMFHWAYQQSPDNSVLLVLSPIEP